MQRERAAVVFITTHAYLCEWLHCGRVCGDLHIAGGCILCSRCEYWQVWLERVRGITFLCSVH